VVAVASALAVGLPFAGAPQLLVRFMAARGSQDIRIAAYISVGVIFLFDLGAVATGLVGRALFGELPDAEAIMPELSRALFPPVITGVLVVAVLSAIMSTVSSLLALATSAAVRDLYQRSLRPQAPTQQVARLGLWVTLGLGVVACSIALQQPRQIFTLVLFASGGLGVAFGPPVICMLWGNKITRAGVLAGMIGGFVTTVFWVLVLKEHAYGLYEVVPGVIAGFVLTILVSALTRREPRAAPASANSPIAPR
jgi:sodium/proline symporter